MILLSIIHYVISIQIINIIIYSLLHTDINYEENFLRILSNFTYLKNNSHLISLTLIS